MIQYEYPFNERIRTLLRLEDLLQRFGFFVAGDDAYHHHVALLTLFEIADVAGRSDLRGDLLKEVDRQRQTLAALWDNPQINRGALEHILTELETSHTKLAGIEIKPSQHLTDNDWLSGLRSRAAIPGGMCEFDLPSYHAWRHGPVEMRRSDLIKWIEPFRPLLESVRLLLKLLRESGHATKVAAIGGSFQQMLSGRNFQLMQVHVENLSLIPEISANKYVIWVRFTQLDGNGKPKPVDADVPFRLTLCNF